MRKCSLDVYTKALTQQEKTEIAGPAKLKRHEQVQQNLCNGRL